MECLISNSSNMHRQKMHIVLLPVFLSPLSKKWLISFTSLELPSLCDSTAAGSGSVLEPGISPGETRSRLSTSWRLGSLSLDSWQSAPWRSNSSPENWVGSSVCCSTFWHHFFGATGGCMGGDACLRLVACALFFLVGCSDMVETSSFTADVGTDWTL